MKKLTTRYKMTWDTLYGLKLILLLKLLSHSQISRLTQPSGKKVSLVRTAPSEGGGLTFMTEKWKIEQEWS